MLVGMGFVYAFLGLLIIIIKTVISPLATRYPDGIPQDPSNKATEIESSEKSGAIVAAISTAVSRYRKDHPTEYKKW